MDLFYVASARRRRRCRRCIDAEIARARARLEFLDIVSLAISGPARGLKAMRSDGSMVIKLRS